MYGQSTVNFNYFLSVYGTVKCSGDIATKKKSNSSRLLSLYLFV